MNTARIFRSGNSQAVRLPKQFRFDTEEVEIYRRGDEIVLRPVRQGMTHVLDLLEQMPADLLVEVDDPPPQERDGVV